MGDIEKGPRADETEDASPNGDAAERVVRIVSRIADVPAADWDTCARGAAPSPTNPFISHAFLRALEESGSATRKTGWLPHHLLLEDGSGTLLGAMPCYLKAHSQGEYVFDHGWADAYERAGGSYYPKLQASVPFTPVPGKRLLVRAGEGEIEREALLLQAAMQVTDRLGISGLHIAFLTSEKWDLAGELDFLKRTDQQFHWRNDGYASFEDFLAALASRKRKTVRKERREALADGIATEWVTGSDLTEAHLDAFFDFYMDTGSRKWGSPYLTRQCFSLLRESMADKMLLVLAKRAGRYIAGALNFIGADTLYGRYWGGIEEHPLLHFEVCYYQAIDFAIQHGLARVEAGAQGAHKLARGYLPSETYSAHYIADLALRRAVTDYLSRERRAVAREMALLTEAAPFRKRVGRERGKANNSDGGAMGGM
ncbi:MAG TPA: GNAT family N-acetyltransferase [Methyloceanibacter sp.]|nr:GNAT family N-acetyltransferase [Methyloceanibacter sp.]